MDLFHNSCDVRALFSRHSSIYGVHTKPNTVTFALSKMRCIATKAITGQEVIGFYYQMLIYETMLHVLNA